MRTLLLMVLLSCASAFAGDEEKAVEALMRRYTKLVKAMDSPAIAALFDEKNGELVNPGQEPIRGRAAIQAFLAGFSGQKVLEYETIPLQTEVDGNSAFHTGTFQQKVRTPEGKILEPKGRYQTQLVRDSPKSPWRILKMGTSPS